MTIVIGLALVVLGLAIGIIVTWALGVGTSVPMSLAIGLLLTVAGAIVGFVVEWLIDEAYRKNRELRRQLLEEEGARVTEAAVAVAPSSDAAAETLADSLLRRDEQMREMSAQLSARETELDRLEDAFDEYRQTHPDDLTVIKGIGSVYQWKLRDAGVHTYAQLARSDPAQLRRMLDVEEWQQVGVESWIEQARDWAQRET